MIARKAGRAARTAAVLGLSLLAACAGRGGGSVPAEIAPPVAAGARPAGIRRTLLAREDVPAAPGLELRLYLIEYDGGVAADPHVHPAVGIGYVLDGGFESAFSGEALTFVRRGEVFVDRADTVHRLFRNARPTEPLRFVIAYVLPKDVPPLRQVTAPAVPPPGPGAAGRNTAEAPTSAAPRSPRARREVAAPSGALPSRRWRADRRSDRWARARDAGRASRRFLAVCNSLGAIQSPLLEALAGRSAIQPSRSPTVKTIAPTST